MLSTRDGHLIFNVVAVRNGATVSIHVYVFRA